MALGTTMVSQSVQDRAAPPRQSGGEGVQGEALGNPKRGGVGG